MRRIGLAPFLRSGSILRPLAFADDLDNRAEAGPDRVGVTAAPKEGDKPECQPPYRSPKST